MNTPMDSFYTDVDTESLITEWKALRMNARYHRDAYTRLVNESVDIERLLIARGVWPTPAPVSDVF